MTPELKNLLKDMEMEVMNLDLGNEDNERLLLSMINNIAEVMELVIKSD